MTSRASLVAAATMLALGVSFDAQALTLGAITVQSALGEPLRAEIEIPQISSDEAANFEAKLGSPQAFSAAGVEYNAALAGTRVSFHRRANGQAYLRLSGSQPVNEPFLGLVIEASWSSGNLVRDYAMLLDPPGRSSPTAVVQAAAAPAQTTTPVAVTPARTESRPATPAPGVAEQVRPSKPAPAAGTRGTGPSVTVQRGTTASAIARAHAMDGVSLDQMLIAMLQANPEAFIRGNVNLIKAGAVLRMPDQDQALATSQTEARRLVVAQTRDFQAYRRSLAQKAPAAAPSQESGRSTSGTVQAEVQDRQAPAPSEDRLTISKAGTSPSDSDTTGTETSTAQSREALEQSERVAELSKNIEELTRLQAGQSPGATADGAPSQAASDSAVPGIELPVGQPVEASAAASDTPAAPTQASADAETSATTDGADGSETAETAPTDQDAQSTDTAAEDGSPEPALAAVDSPDADSDAPETSEEEPVAAPAPVVEEPKPVRAPVPAPVVAEPSFVETLADNPLLPVAGAGLLALLAGLGLYRSRQRKKQDNDASLDSEFIESQLQPDSFFGASGGQHIDTKDHSSGLGGSSMMYSPSQLDAAGDVDPVAEANVYLAYGRDGQAEDILKEALLTHPDRASIHQKLAEIYAKRQDAPALEAIAGEAHKLTQGIGPEWQAIAALGLSLDPNNPLYQPGGAPRPAAASAEQAGQRMQQFGADTEPAPATLETDTGPGALDSGPTPLDLNLTLDAALTQPAPMDMLDQHGGEITKASELDLPLDLDLGTQEGDLPRAETATPAAAPITPPASSPAPARVQADSEFVDLDLSMDFAPPEESTTARPTLEPAHTPNDSGMIEFDMSALAVDPDSRSDLDHDTQQSEDDDDDPLATKLALAQEFNAIGDTEGARDLAQEVVAEATGALKIRAERFLADL